MRPRLIAVGVGLVSFLAALLLGITAPGPARAAPPAGWRQVNVDGFGVSTGFTSTRLFVCGDNLFAHNDDGLFVMASAAKRVWNKVMLPGSPQGASFTPLGGCLYFFTWPGNLYLATDCSNLGRESWKKVTILEAPSAPIPKVVFRGQVYGPRYDQKANTFQVWRSKNVCSTVMKWELVVTNSFGDPQNNQSLAFLEVVRGRIVAGTNTLKGMFGSPTAYASGGVEVWESPTGDKGDWKQVNVDGFGTTSVYPTTGQKLYTNQVIFSRAVYPPGTRAEALYVGTASHFEPGAQVWRYTGGGLNGWRNVTPPWAMFPSRNWAMAVYQDKLYMAEGFPSGNLGVYDGKQWKLVVKGPEPFSAKNQGLYSLAVFHRGLYASTHPKPTYGDQVWGFPYP